MVQVVTANDINTSSLEIANAKLGVKVDGASIVEGANGLEVSVAGLTLVSADANNVLATGSDGGVWISNEEIQDAIGELVVSTTDGLTYDDAINALTASVASALGANSDTIQMNVTLGNDGTLNISAQVILDPAADNILTQSNAGLKATIMNNTTLQAGTAFTVDINGQQISTPVTELQDLNGNRIGDVLS